MCEGQSLNIVYGYLLCLVNFVGVGDDDFVDNRESSKWKAYDRAVRLPVASSWRVRWPSAISAPFRVHACRFELSSSFRALLRVRPPAVPMLSVAPFNFCAESSTTATFASGDMIVLAIEFHLSGTRDLKNSACPTVSPPSTVRRTCCLEADRSWCASCSYRCIHLRTSM